MDLVTMTVVVVALFAGGVVLLRRYLTVAVDCDHAAVVYHLFNEGEKRDGLLFNLIGLRYVNRLAYAIFGKRLGYSARLFFMLFAMICGALILFAVLPFCGFASAMTAAAVFFVVTASPALEPHNDCSEKYAILPIGMGYAMIVAAATGGEVGWYVAAFACFLATSAMAKITDLVHLLAVPLSAGIASFFSSTELAVAAIVPAVVFAAVTFRYFTYVRGLFRYARESRRISMREFSRKLSIFLVPFAIRNLPLFGFFAYALARHAPSEGPLLDATALWFALGWVSILVQGRFFGYHFFVIVPPLAIGSAVGIHGWFDQFASAGLATQAIGIAGLAWLAVALLSLAKSVLFASPEALHRLLWGRLGEYYYWEGAAPAIGAYVRSRTNENDHILQWGDTHQVYLFAGRRASTRNFCGKYVFNMHGVEWIKGVLQDVVSRPPALVILMRKEIDMEALEALTGLGYVPESTLVWKGMEMPVYRLQSRRPPDRSVDEITMDDCLRLFHYEAGRADVPRVVLA